MVSSGLDMPQINNRPAFVSCMTGIPNHDCESTGQTCLPAGAFHGKPIVLG